MNVLLLGATGPTGRAVLTLAQGKEHPVRALARDPSVLPERPGFEVVRGDVRDASSLSRALVGVDVVLGAFGVSGFANAFKPTDLYSVGIRNLLSAMREVGTRRLIMVSSSAVVFDPQAGFFWNRVLRPFMWPMYADVSTMELRIAESDLAWTVVRPPQLIDGPGRGPCRVVPGDLPAGAGYTLARTDLAAFLLQEMEAGAYVRQRVVLAPAP
jgi:uncharacterized protein YbjT (DUF2867 family)